MPKSFKSNQSIEKIFGIIEILAGSVEPLRLIDISLKADIPAPTALRLVNTLVELGYAYQETGGALRYGLTLKFLQIGNQISEHFNLRDIAHPFLLELSQRIGETCCISIDDGGMVRYIDVVESSNSNLLIRQRIGGTAFMHSTGSGKVLMLGYTEKQFEEYAQKSKMKALTAKTITDLEKLKAAVAEVTAAGYAIDDEECEIGMRCIAVPVAVAGSVQAAVCLSGPLARMTYERIQTELLPLLLSCAAGIAKSLGA